MRQLGDHGSLGTVAWTRTGTDEPWLRRPRPGPSLVPAALVPGMIITNRLADRDQAQRALGPPHPDTLVS